MDVSHVSERSIHTFSDRAEALGHFFARAGEAPRIVAFDEEMGCPLLNALSACCMRPGWELRRLQRLWSG
jgi:hypothetical protein